MSDLFGRSVRLAKNYYEEARGRVEELSTQAQDELSRALNRDDIKQGLAASDDPMERAQAKLAAAQGRAAQAREQSPGTFAPEPPASTDPVATAYRILGVAPGADYLTVQTAANTLRERCNPDRFPAGSAEQTRAKNVLQKVEEAYQLLQMTLDPKAGRFDKLEI